MSELVTNEPTHLDEDGKSQPGAAPLDAVVDKSKVDLVEEVTKAFHKNADNRNRYSAQNPQISEPYSPLQALVYDAIREYGETNPGIIDGEVSLLFLRLANKVIEDVRSHPLYPIPDMDYYIALTDIREVPDIIVYLGLQHYYALQQSSQKIQLKTPEYYSRLSSVLYNRKYGNAQIEITPRK